MDKFCRGFNLANGQNGIFGGDLISQKGNYVKFGKDLIWWMSVYQNLILTKIYPLKFMNLQVGDAGHSSSPYLEFAENLVIINN